MEVKGGVLEGLGVIGEENGDLEDLDVQRGEWWLLGGLRATHGLVVSIGGLKMGYKQMGHELGHKKQ